MRWYPMGLMGNTSPIGLLFLGTIIGAVGLPVLRKTARTAAVLTVSGVLMATGAVKKVGQNISREKEHLAADVGVRQVGETPSMHDCIHSAGVGVVKKGMELGEEINSKLQSGKVKLAGCINRLIAEDTTSNDMNENLNSEQPIVSKENKPVQEPPSVGVTKQEDDI